MLSPAAAKPQLEVVVRICGRGFKVENLVDGKRGRIDKVGESREAK